MSVKSGLSSKELIQQSNCFIFQEGRVLTYNDEISVSTPFDADFTCAVPAAPLMSVLSKFKGDTVEMNVVDGELKLNCGKAKTGIKIHADITIPLGAVVPPETYHAANPDLPLALGMVAHSCGKDTSRYTLTCVHVSPSHVEACDGFQATRYSLKTEGLDLLIPQTAAKHLSGLKISEVGTNNGWMFCKSGELTFACRTYQEEYPSLDAFMNNKGEPITLPSVILSSLEGASCFADIENKAIKIEIKDGKVTVKAENDAGWFEEQSAEVEYTGEKTILINPLFLATLLKHGSNCELSDNALIMRNDCFSHIAALCAKAK